MEVVRRWNCAGTVTLRREGASVLPLRFDRIDCPIKADRVGTFAATQRAHQCSDGEALLPAMPG
ncbi:hypothetical protein BN159_0039 [Streptomyces davaonensis JCM 4913]|uniref:Uncharacterized protein n=1 Tax=Streptomyces davaonensis (strain DSM 101723 / JCM 4913 / KCC S-0913 / 768) TaxID=1214101 RepID=K4QU50_STRDJ|nr:hypothetical protein BN159_0039 [Streptomyces davaonensis JCM 4913]